MRKETCNNCKHKIESDGMYYPALCSKLNVSIKEPSTFFCGYWEKPTEYTYQYAVQASDGIWFMSIPLTDEEYKQLLELDKIPNLVYQKLDFTKAAVK